MYKRYGWVLLVLALVSPLGLLANKTAWGEWDADGLNQLVGYIPQGITIYGGMWKAIFPDYSLQFLGESWGGVYVGYILGNYRRRGCLCGCPVDYAATDSTQK